MPQIAGMVAVIKPGSLTSTRLSMEQGLPRLFDAESDPDEEQEGGPACLIHSIVEMLGRTAVLR